MEDTVLFAAAEAIVFYKLGIGNTTRSGCGSGLPYNGSYVEVKPSEYIDEQEPPYFDIRRAASERPSDICVFSVKKGSDWDFYIVRTSVLDSCFGGQSAVNLAMIKPFALHVNICGIKQAVDLTVEAA